MEGIVGVGCTIAPVLGVFVYGAVGFSNTFYIFGSAMTPCAFMMLCLPNPKELKQNKAKAKANVTESGEDLLN
jgi:hypothetical protein